MIASAAGIPERITSSGIDQILYVLSKINISGYNGYVTEMDGQVDEGLLSRSIRLAMNAEPILGCRFVADPKKPYWERRPDIDSQANCSLVTTEDPAPDAEARMLKPYDPDRDPFLFVTILRSSRSGDHLLWQVSHCIADEIGTFQVIRLICSIYSELLIDAQYEPAPRGEYDWNFPLFEGLGRKQKFLLWRNAFLGMFEQVRMAQSPTVGYRADLQSYFAEGARRNPAFVRFKFDHSEYQAIKKAAFARKCWVNDLLTAAFLRAFSKLAPALPGARHRVLYMIDLRRHLPESYATPVCNLLGYHLVDIGTDLGLELSETLDKVRSQNTLLNDPTYTLRNVVFGLPMMRRTSLKSKQNLMRKTIVSLCKKGAPPSLAFLGNLDPAAVRLGKLETIDLYSLPIFNPLPAFSPIAAGFRNTLSLTMSFNQNGITRDQIQGLFQSMRDEMMSFSQSIGI